ncbi:MAG: MFS transporter [Spirochaetes bacterium]|nr:MFS transporter [Spirochaetota bacterium]
MLLILLSVLFLSMLSRLIFSPLLVFIQKDLSLTGRQAGSLFLVITAGYSPGMLFSGFASSRLRHRGTIALSLVLVAAGTFIACLSQSYMQLSLGVWILGMGSGMYPPSGIASITTSISEEKAGKALAIHELGPALAFVMAPLLVVALYSSIGWRMILALIGLLNLGMAAFYRWYGIGGEGFGQPPHFSKIRAVVGKHELWYNFLLFCVALSSMQGLYSILPYYLITVKGLDPRGVNLLVGLSRITGILTLLASGYLVDRFGSRFVLILAFTVGGISTLFLVWAKGPLLELFVVLQPALLSAFFPAGLLALSRIGSPESQNVTIALVINFAVLFGNGIVPSLMGWLADAGAIEIGFLTLGGAMLVMVLSLYRNRAYGAY